MILINLNFPVQMMSRKGIMDIFDKSIRNNVENKKHLKTYLIACLCFLGIAITPHTTASNKHTWKPLFGQNLSEANYTPGIWQMKGNILLAGPDECIWTENEYESFELDIEFNNSEGARSSVILYCIDRDNWEPNSIKIQLADPAAVSENGHNIEIICGTIHGQDLPAQDGIVKNAGEWNHLRIRSAGNRLSVILNGRKVTEWDMNILPNPPVRGHIGLEGYPGEASLEFRNLKIREIIENETKSSSMKREREPRIFPQY